MKEKLNSFEHFLQTCENKADFTFYGIDTLPDHPAHFFAKEDYSILDCFMVFSQDGGNKGPYTLYLPLQIWVPDAMGDITFDELVDFKDEIQAITIFSDDDGDYVLIYKK